MTRFRLLGAAVVFASLAQPAHASSNGDMFDNGNAGLSGRPQLPGDRQSGYAGPPDMFDKPASETPDGNDMFDSTQPAADPGIEQRFSAHPPPVPDTPLFGSPGNGTPP